MNFKLLRELVILFKKKLRCSVCNKTISNKELHIESIENDNVNFKCECTACKNTMYVKVSLFKAANMAKKERSHQTLKLQQKKSPIISSNDVLDVKNFLKVFKGDFKEIFRK